MWSPSRRGEEQTLSIYKRHTGKDTDKQDESECVDEVVPVHQIPVMMDQIENLPEYQAQQAHRRKKQDAIILQLWFRC